MNRVKQQLILNPEDFDAEEGEDFVEPCYHCQELVSHSEKIEHLKNQCSRRKLKLRFIKENFEYDPVILRNLDQWKSKSESKNENLKLKPAHMDPRPANKTYFNVIRQSKKEEVSVLPVSIQLALGYL